MSATNHKLNLKIYEIIVKFTRNVLFFYKFFKKCLTIFFSDCIMIKNQTFGKEE